MLIELKVTHFAIIDNIHIEFGPGFNILSGETGAGKSVLIKSLGLLMGAKGSLESIRSGQPQASIEGSFDLSHRADLVARLEDSGIEVEENLLVVRRVLSEGKSRVYLNGVPSTLSTLRELVFPLVEVAGATAPLIEMTGQHESKSLLSKSYQLELLDHYIGATELRQRYVSMYLQWRRIETEIEKFTLESKDKVQRLDYLRYQLDEIQNLELSENEDLSIVGDLQLLKNSARLLEFAQMTEETLDGSEYSTLRSIQTIVQRAQDLQNIAPILTEKCQSFVQAKILIEDGLYELRTQVERIEGDPERQNTLEDRLSSIRKLQKKFGPSLSDVLRNFEVLKGEIAALENFDKHLETLSKQSQKFATDLKVLADDLHKRRLNGAKILGDSINEELRDLNMKGVRFHVEILKTDSLGPTGSSDIEFQIQTSASEPRRTLAKVASGGELSRILLSLKRVVGSSGQPRTYLFDEVDTGVSGETAEKVGRKLRSIAKDQQVICVTHLPQVAAFGDIHFFIQKNPKKSSVAMEVQRLSRKERIEEIARLISGQKVTKTSLAHAEVLLKQAISPQ